MAVVIEAFDVVLPIDAVERSYPGGLAAFRHDAPNGTYCSDGVLCRLSFMVERDRASFTARLAEQGLTTSDGVALVRESELLETPTLVCGPYAGVHAAWRPGVAQEPLVVPLGYRPDSIQFESPEEMAAHLEYVGTEGGVETYRDRRTGRLYYTGRTQPELSPETADRLEALRREGVELLQPFLGVGGPAPNPGFLEKRRIRKGIARLREVLEVIPHHASTLWIIGMALRTLREHEQALDHLRRAHMSDPMQPDMGREYACQCMILGLGDEAVQAARVTAQRHPGDAGLLSNLGLAYLIAGDVDRALDAVREALALEPDDPITNNLLRLAEDVKAGTREAPARLPGF